VFAIVTATNSIGTSPDSAEGNGAQIVTTPVSPFALAEVEASRTPTSLGFSWTEGPFNGGSAILDYRVSFALEGQSLQFLDTVSETQYTATGLTTGETYIFAVESRNVYAFSSLSETLTMLCAFKPESPTNVQTAIEANTVRVSWSPVYDNGSPLTSYSVYIR